MKIAKYTYKYKEQWDNLVENSKNGTFLHHRNFMEYHRDRFSDCSLLCLDNNDNLIAALPANINGDTAYSHQGLTYGGWIIPSKGFTVTTMLDLWRLMTGFLLSIGAKRLIYKATPHIYHRYPAEEDLYALFRHSAQISSTLISTTLPLDNTRLNFNENARRGMKHALSHEVTIEQSTDFNSFWPILTQNLASRYNTVPVHSLSEIALLASQFPHNIKLFTAKKHNEVIAGTVMFFTHTVAHAQYISASPLGKELKALPALFHHIITHECGSCRYFDFGTSNEDNGTYLNEGLITQKCGMGGRAIAYTTYHVELGTH